MSPQFSLDAAVLRRQRRVILSALSSYLPAAAIMISLTAWVAARNDGAWPPILIGLATVQVCYFAVVCIYQAIGTERMLRRAGTPAGRLTLTGSGADDGQRSWAWPDVERVRAYRTSVPHLRIYMRRTGLRRRVVPCRSTVYGVGVDELIAAFEPFVPIADPDRPPAPAREAGGTTTFFFNHWQLSARRRRNLRSCWQVPLMAIPAAVGLGVAGWWPVAGAVLVPAVVLIAVTTRRVLATDRLLALGKNGQGRLLLTPGDLTLAGTDVAIPWSHVQEAALVRGEEPRVTGIISCPDPAHQDERHCRFADRSISFSIGARMYATTIDDVAAAFGEHVPVAARD
ncbi:MAG TPA: hypothetical protein VF506_04885 [Streptosporangiaceae bacterium]